MKRIILYLIMAVTIILILLELFKEKETSPGASCETTIIKTNKSNCHNEGNYTFIAKDIPN